jgi:FKBP-type peptidyl-prolyl cis-trans isomerase FkpA
MKNTLSLRGIIGFSLGLLLITACNREEDGFEEEQVRLQQYLEDNGYTDVQPTSSGLYHVVLEQGQGASPQTTDYINISFTSALVDGTIFETSDEDVAIQAGIARDDVLYGPSKLLLGNIGISGLREGIALMQEGGSSRIIIPSNLAFGPSDHGIIPPYSTLIYDVVLHNVISDPVEHEQNLINEYIAENNIEVTTHTGSGLYYVEEVAGSGDLPGANSNVTVHYEGALLDGRVFTESPVGQPLVVNMSNQNIIAGLIEGVSYMRPGGQATLIIPWNIGFGPEGSPDGFIPPYTTLVFTIELLGIN